MKSPLLKGLLVVVVAVVSIGICIIGYQRTRQQTDKPQESETEVSIPSPDSDTLADLDVFKQQLDELYIDDNEQFIAEGTSSEEVAQLTEELNNSAVSPENTELSEERAQLLTALEIVSAKISIQEATNQLFVVARMIGKTWKKDNQLIVMFKKQISRQLKTKWLTYLMVLGKNPFLYLSDTVENKFN